MMNIHYLNRQSLPSWRLIQCVRVILYVCLALSFQIEAAADTGAGVSRADTKVDDTDVASVSLYKAVSFYENKQLELAKQQFKAALGTTTQEEALVYLGRIAYDQGDPKTASTYLLKAIAIGPSSSDEYYWLARAYASQARNSGSLRGLILAKKIKKYAKLAVETDPNSVHALRLLIDFKLYAPSFIGGSTKEAQEDIDQLHKLSSLDASIKQLELFSRKKQSQKALASARSLILKHPESAEAHHVAGLSFRGNGLLDEALQCFEQGLSIQETPANAYYIDRLKFRYAETALLNNTETDKAISVLTSLLSASTNHAGFEQAWPTWTLAKLYLYKGQGDRYIKLRDSLSEDTLKKDKVLSKDIERYNDLYRDLNS
ncbi:tetratricopeptide repeat protein [Agaribacterium sp. ZY112]|uniref:tetratricopeptide repeat protein n=1 Tax=Agaribacterium sp. ZY112 TaxID=3233574 RepID=UPI003525AAAF